MTEQEAREWLLKRRGGLGICGTDPTDWGSDLADLMAPEILAKATYVRRRNWISLCFYLLTVGLLGLTIVLCYSWWFNGASGYPALIAGAALVAVAHIAERVQRYFDLRDLTFGIYN
jgi:hypothetical protein